MEIGLLLIRLVVGLLLAGHGAQKLFGWFGGHGLNGTGGFMETLGLRPGTFHAAAAGMAEFGGGVLLALGLVTPLAAALVGATMVVAIVTVHWSKGIWSTNGGYELPLTYAAVAIGLAFNGAGRWSLDHAIGWNLHGLGWGLAATAVALIGAAGIGVEIRRPHSASPARG
jgi:putative oxidoreductase